MAAYASIYEKTIKYIDERIKDDMTLEELAKFAGYSVRHLYKIFEAFSPVPIMEYIRHKKLCAAANEIYAGRKLFDVALDYGYETPAGFYKAFQAVFGCAPSEYKNNTNYKTRRNIFMNISNAKNIRELEEIEEFFDTLYAGSPIGRKFKEGEKYSREWWAGQFGKHPELLLCAKDGDKICGAIFGWVEQNNNATVSGDAVLKEYESQGIHEALFIEFEKRAKKLGCIGIGLGIGEGQEEFYAKLGYTGSMLVQSEKHSVDELKNFLGGLKNKSHEITATNVYDGYVNQLWLRVSILDKELKKQFEEVLGDCWTQIVVGKGL